MLEGLPGPHPTQDLTFRSFPFPARSAPRSASVLAGPVGPFRQVVPMPTVQKRGHAEFGDRDLYTLDLRHYKLPPGAFSAITGHFIACLAMDGSEATDAELKTLAAGLIQAGCSYICCWGPDCERVHDLIDREDLELHPAGPWKMTTWQNDVHLSEALWFVLNSAWPDAAFEDTTHAVVGIAIGNPGWSAQMEAAFSDPLRFSRQAPNP
jgi:hypothetical protein